MTAGGRMVAGKVVHLLLESANQRADNRRDGLREEVLDVLNQHAQTRRGK